MHLTNAILAPAITTAPINFDLLQYCLQGVSFDGGRVGNDIVVIGIAWEGVLMGGQTNVVLDDKYNIVRMLITECTPAALGTFNPSLVSSVSPRTFPGIKRVIHDETWTLASPGPDSVGYMPPTRHIKHSVKLNVPVSFSQANAGSGSETFQTLMVTLVSDSVIAPSPGFVSSKMTTFYTDN